MSKQKCQKNRYNLAVSWRHSNILYELIKDLSLKNSIKILVSQVIFLRLFMC